MYEQIYLCNNIFLFPIHELDIKTNTNISQNLFLKKTQHGVTGP